MLTKKFPKRSGIKGEPKSQKNKDRTEPRIKEVYKHKQSGKGHVLISSFRAWIKQQYADKGLEIHHFYGSSMGKYDCFVTIIGHELHAKIHHGANDGGVKNYIEMRGERILIIESMRLMERWLNDALTDWKMIKKYQPLIDAILADVDNAVNIAKNFNL